MRWRRNPQVSWRAAPGYLVVSTIDGRVVEGGGTATDVWLRLADWIDEAELLDDLASHFTADKGELAADVRDFLATLRAEGCVDAAG